ncbi:MAG: hypothetical protein H7068_06705 [Pedobacter sp.]|nr:hypothetical protein [Chitinophagaceae bacterium]
MEASFGKIQLPDFLLVDFFKDNLVLYDDKITTKEAAVIKEEKPIAATATSPLILTKKQEIIAPKKWFFGDNTKQILILVKDTEAVYLRDEWLQFLTNILGACKLNIGDVAIVNYANNPINFTSLNEQLNPQFYLMFDVASQDILLPFTVPNYQLQKFGNATFLLAPSLALMQGNTEAVKMEKSRLWLSLKKLFNI